MKKVIFAGLSLCLGGLGTISILLHLGIAQNFNLFGKIVLLLFGVVPLSVFLFTSINIIISNLAVNRLIVSIVVTWISLLLISSIYTLPDPVKHHIITIASSSQVGPTKSFSFEIRRIEIRNQITKQLSPDSFKALGNKYPGEVYQYSPGTALSLSLQYSGSLVVFPDSNYCPNIVVITSDGKTKQQDLCLVNKESGLILSNSESGTIPPRWIFLYRVIKVIDFTLLAYGIFALISIFELLLILIIQNLIT